MAVTKFSCQPLTLLILSNIFLPVHTFLVPTSDIAGITALISGTPILEGYADLTCSWFLKEGNVLRYVTITTIENQMSITILNVFKNNNFHLTVEPQSDNRFTFNLAPNKVIMRIKQLKCSDEQVYTCTCVFGSKFNTSSSNQTVSDSVRLFLQVPPGSVNITIEVPGSVQVENYVQVHLGDSISAVCSGIIDATGHPIIYWSIYRNWQVETISTTDPRLKTLEYVASLPEDPSCSRRVQQAFTLQVTEGDYFIAISCFLRYKNTPGETLYCWKSNKDICVRSVKVIIAPYSTRYVNKPPTVITTQCSENYRTEAQPPVSTIIGTVVIIFIVIGCIVGSVMFITHYIKKDNNKSDDNDQE